MRALDRSTLTAALPVALAIATFGAIYGTAAQQIAEPMEVLLASIFIFSGALQFTVVGLLVAGAQTGAVILAAATLNARHILLGAVLRGRIDRSPFARAGLAWFLLDETTGLSLNATRPAPTLFVTGLICYLAWVGGTALGLLGGSIDALRSAAAAVFPVLFIGLAALACTNRALALRAVVAAALTVPLALAWPGGRGMAPVVAALVAAIPGRGAGSAGPQNKSGAGSAGPQNKSGAGSAGPQNKSGAGSAGPQNNWGRP